MKLILVLSALLFAGGADAKTWQVAIKGMVFVPATLDVAVGDTVVWTNEDIVPHTVTGPGFDSGAIASGKTFETTIKAKGPVAYKCLFHPTMSGSLKAQ